MLVVDANEFIEVKESKAVPLSAKPVATPLEFSPTSLPRLFTLPFPALLQPWTKSFTDAMNAHLIWLVGYSRLSKLKQGFNVIGGAGALRNTGSGEKVV